MAQAFRGNQCLSSFCSSELKTALITVVDQKKMITMQFI